MRVLKSESEVTHEIEVLVAHLAGREEDDIMRHKLRAFIAGITKEYTDS